MKSCIMFDLDGTLIDSREDIAAAINATRADFGMEALPLATVVGYTGDGVHKLMQRSFAGTEVNIADAVRLMNAHYAEHPVVKTTVYPGVMEGFRTFAANHRAIGVVSNKPTELCKIILQELKLADWCDEIIGGSSGFPLKPHPAALLHILEKTNSTISDSWFCGDNHTDMDAAKNAGIKGAFAAYGFGNPADSSYDLKIDAFHELLEILR